MRLRNSTVFSLAFLFCCGAPVWAQTAASADPGQAFLFKTNAHAVVVDVVVTRSNGEAVTALHKEDFKVTEDGKPQTIDFFEEHTAKSLPPGAVPQMPKMPPNVYTNVPPAPESDAVNVLLLDTLNTERTDQILVHHQIDEFLKTMQPGTRVAIFTLGSKLRFVQGFTTDTSVLLAALNDKKTGVLPDKDPQFQSREDRSADAQEVQTRIMLMNGHFGAGIEGLLASQREAGVYDYGMRMSMTLEALNYLAHYLAGVPGRKNLIWFASSFPVTIFPSLAQKEAMNDALHVYTSTVKKVADLMTVAKVAVYPVGGGGVMGNHIMDADLSGQGQLSGTALTRGLMAENGGHAERILEMEQLANDTGGKAFYNTNDLNVALGKAIADGSHYYTLVYTPTDKKMNGRYRSIEIKPASGKMKMSYRHGYNADDLAALNPAVDGDPLRPLLKFGLPGSSQLLYGVRVVPIAPQPAQDAKRAGQNAKLTGPTTRYSVDFMIRRTDVKLNPVANGAHSGKIELGLVAYDRNGVPVNWAGATQAMTLTPEMYAAIQSSGIPAHMEIDLPDTEVSLQTGVYDWGTSKAGTLEIALHPTAK